MTSKERRDFTTSARLWWSDWRFHTLSASSASMDYWASTYLMRWFTQALSMHRVQLNPKDTSHE